MKVTLTESEQLRGKILEYSVRKGKGIISGADGGRYEFLAESWIETEHPRRGLIVDFERNKINEAIDIFIIDSSTELLKRPIIQPTESHDNKIFIAITALIISLFSVLALFGAIEEIRGTDSFTIDGYGAVGLLFLNAISMTLSIITLKNNFSGCNMAITAMVLSALVAVFTVIAMI